MAPELEHIATEFEPQVRRWVGARIAGPDSDDVSQDIMCAIIEAWPRFRGKSSVRTWVYAICRNQLYKNYRLRRTRPVLEVLERDICAPDVDPVTRDPADVMAVQFALQQLPVRFQNMVRMRYRERMSLEEIAGALQISVGTVKFHFYEIRLRMRRILE